MGVLPSQSISKLISKKIIFADREIEKNQIQPASLDLRLGQVAWRIRASFLTGKEKKISDLLNEAIATLGENIVIARFIRFAVGENSSSS